MSSATATAGDTTTAKHRESSRLRVSGCGVWCWQDGRLLWDDYLDHHQYSLAEDCERVLPWFADWRDTTSVRALGHTTDEADRYQRMAEVLADHDVLVREGSARHAREDTVLRSWSTWGPLARAFHYATRTGSSDLFLSPEQQRDAFEAKRIATPVPEPVPMAADRPYIALPRATEEVWRHRDLLDVLRGRRSHRTFGLDPVSLVGFGALLEIGAGVTGMDRGTGTVFKTSPSGGGRHPTEVYPYVRNVEGVEPGVYHYDPLRHVIELVGDLPSTQELIAACGDQHWVADAATVLCYVSSFGRNAWKYDNPRSYRVLLLDVGHLNQTLLLTATALGMRATFTAALRDELIERHLGIEPATELVIGCTAVGSASDPQRDESGS